LVWTFGRLDFSPPLYADRKSAPSGARL
jgi:hypothetical protein